MTNIQAWIDDSRAHADRAAAHVANIAAGVERWTMKVPPADTDTDITLIGLLDGTLGRALNALQAVLDTHRPLTVDAGEEEILFCPECFDVEDVGGADTWPCPTVLVIADALGEVRS